MAQKICIHFFLRLENYSTLIVRWILSKQINAFFFLYSNEIFASKQKIRVQKIKADCLVFNDGMMVPGSLSGRGEGNPGVVLDTTAGWPLSVGGRSQEGLPCGACDHGYGAGV